MIQETSSEMASEIFQKNG